MEWEVMFMCNLLGVVLLISIALFHVLGTPPEKNAKYLDFSSENKKEN